MSPVRLIKSFYTQVDVQERGIKVGTVVTATELGEEGEMLQSQGEVEALPHSPGKDLYLKDIFFFKRRAR